MDISMLYRTKGYSIKHFTFCYNNACQIYKNVKYSVSYQPQKLELLGFKGTNKLLYRLDIKDNKFNVGEIFTNNKIIRAAYQKYMDLKKVILEAETKTAIRQGLVTRIITLLDILSITL